MTQHTDTPPNADTRYHAGAYRSSDFLEGAPNSPLQKTGKPSGIAKKLVGQTLGFTHPSEIIAIGVAEDSPPSKMNDETLPDGFSGWSAQRCLQHTGNGLFNVYIFITGLAKALCVFGTPAMFLTVIIMFIKFGSEATSAAIEFIYYYFLYAFLPCGLIWGQFELFNRGYWKPWFLKIHKMFEFNRQTGMVTLFDKHSRPRYNHPFVEFDCTLESIPNHQDLISYNLLLTHRYSDAKYPVPVGMFITQGVINTTQYHQLWNMVQRYMDTSQTLPDIPQLEAYRADDPITAAHDQKTGRNPRYWRDMSDEEFEQTIEDLDKQQQTQATTGPLLNIFEGEEA